MAFIRERKMGKSYIKEVLVLTVNHHCEGCLDYHCGYIKSESECIRENLQGDCPCTNCIVKTMCTANTICDNFRNSFRIRKLIPHFI
jgi:hypothetical protein